MAMVCVCYKFKQFYICFGPVDNLLPDCATMLLPMFAQSFQSVQHILAEHTSTCQPRRLIHNYRTRLTFLGPKIQSTAQNEIETVRRPSPTSINIIVKCAFNWCRQAPNTLDSQVGYLSWSDISNKISNWRSPVPDPRSPIRQSPPSLDSLTKWNFIYNPGQPR